MIATFGLVGCTAGPTPILPPSAAASTGQGDWDDIDAAVEVGAQQSECVVSSYPAVPRDRQNFERHYALKHVSGATGALIITRPDPAAANAPLQLRCSMGRFGDAKLERTIIDRTQRRLADLRGKDFAPIRE